MSPRPGSPFRTVRVAAAALVVVGVLEAPTWSTGSPALAGHEVYESLRKTARVRVMVSLREPDVPFDDLQARAIQIADIRHAVLKRLEPGEFRLIASWDTSAAMAGEVTLSGVEGLLADPLVRRVDVDAPLYATRLGESANAIHADAAHDRGITGRGIVVAVLDTGAQSDHPDLASAISGEQCFCTTASGGGCCPNGSTQQSGAGGANDDQGHGTNVSGIIVGRGGAAPKGIAPEASLVSIKVLDGAGGASSTTQVVSGLDFIARSRTDVKVVNLSLATGNLFSGSSCDGAASFIQAMASSINTLKSRGVAVFASSGNNGNATNIAAPACIASAIAVGATYDENVGTVTFGCTDASTGRDQVACFSNASPAVDILAPGGAITAAGRGGGASTFFGTSQAAPHAAGVAALIFQAKGGISPDALVGLMQSTGQGIADSRNGQAFKRVDAGAATQ